MDEKITTKERTFATRGLSDVRGRALDSLPCPRCLSWPRSMRYLCLPCLGTGRIEIVPALALEDCGSCLGYGGTSGAYSDFESVYFPCRDCLETGKSVAPFPVVSEQIICPYCHGVASVDVGIGHVNCGLCGGEGEVDLSDEGIIASLIYIHKEREREQARERAE